MKFLKRENGLRQLLSREEILVLPGIYDCISARIAEQAGFEAVFTSGFGISASTLGMPDYGYLTVTEMIWTVKRIINSVSIPVIVDIDTGYGNPLNVIRTVKEIININASGVIIEDQEWPKKCGHFENKSVVPKQEHIEKIKSAVEARQNHNLLIIARTDSRAVNGLKDAIKRGELYIDAGADMLFIEAPETTEELEEIAKAFPDTPLLANMVEGGRTPLLSASKLQDMGYKIAVYPISGLFSSTLAINRCFEYLFNNKSTEGFSDMWKFERFEQFIDKPSHTTLEKKFSTKANSD